MLIEMTLLTVMGAYLVGAIPIGYIIGRLHGIDDIRRYGSGVIGATNIGRILGLKYFFLILLLDACKAYAYLSLCTLCGVPRIDVLLCAFALLIGNSYSIFIGSGGKGVATMAGIVLALNPMLWIISIFTWIVSFFMIRTVGIASVITALLLPLYAILFADIYGFLFMAIMVAWIIWRHRANIQLFYMVR